MYRHLKWLALAFCLFVTASAQANFTQVAINGSGSVGGSCWTTGSDGWTVICSTTITSGTCTQAGARDANGTCFVAVSSSAGNDGTCDSFTTQAAAIAAPCLHINTGCNLIRNPSADHLLLKKNDTWTTNGTTETADCLASLKFSGISATQPAAILPYGTGTRPKIITIHTSGNGACIGSSLGGGRTSDMGNNIAIIGIECYNAERDPNNVAFNPDPLLGVPGTGLSPQNSYDSLLVEDTKFSFYQNNLGIDAGQANNFTHHNTRIRRNLLLDSYNTDSGFTQGIHAALNFGTFLIEENLIDNGGCLCAGAANAVMSPITATLTVASPSVIAAAFSWPMYNGAGMSFHANSDTLPGATFTGAISGTTLTVSGGVSGTIAIGQSVYDVGNGSVLRGTTVTGGSGTSWTVSQSQTVGSTTLYSGLTTGFPYEVLNPGVGGANTFWLTSDQIAVITAKIDNGSGSAGNTLTVSGTITNQANIQVGMTVTGSGVTPAQITACPGGGCGGTGAYTIGGSAQNVASERMVVGTPIVTTGSSQAGTHKIAWDAPGGSPQATTHSHCAYLDASNDPVTFHGNIVTNCSDNGLQGRPGGVATSNYFAQTPEVGFLAGANNIFSNNVVDGPAGWSCGGLACPTEANGPTLNATAYSTASGNTVANGGPSAGAAVSISDAFDDCGRISFSIANPTIVMYYTGRVAVDQVISVTQAAVHNCNGTGVLPSPITNGTTYFVVSQTGPYNNLSCPSTPVPPFGGTCNWAATISTTKGGTPISTLGSSQSGSFAPLFYSYQDTVTNNVIYNYGNSTGNANITDSSVNSGTNTISGNPNFNSGGGGFTGCGGSPNNCTAGNYNAQLSDCASLPAGCTATLAAFIINVRAQSKDNWRDELMAKAVGTWIRAGFGQGAIN